MEKAETRRLFVALPVPADFAARTGAALPRENIGGRWSAAADLHITLRFLGDLPPESADAVRGALARVRRPNFHIDVRGLGIFETPRSTVLYARIESTRKMNALCGDITDVLVPLGFDFTTRPFIPHITLARLTTPRYIAQYIEKYDKFVRGHWLGESFSLMQSGTGDSTDSRYMTVAQYPLLS